MQAPSEWPRPSGPWDEEDPIAKLKADARAEAAAERRKRADALLALIPEASRETVKRHSEFLYGVLSVSIPGHRVITVSPSAEGKPFWWREYDYFGPEICSRSTLRDFRTFGEALVAAELPVRAAGITHTYQLKPKRRIWPWLLAGAIVGGGFIHSLTMPPGGHYKAPTTQEAR